MEDSIASENKITVQSLPLPGIEIQDKIQFFCTSVCIHKSFGEPDASKITNKLSELGTVSSGLHTAVNQNVKFLNNFINKLSYVDFSIFIPIRKNLILIIAVSVFFVLFCIKYSQYLIVHTANEGPVRIQYKCLVPIYVFPRMKLLFPKQNYNVLSPSSYTLISVRDLYISRIGLPFLLQGNMWTDPGNICISCSPTHECGNWD